MEMSKVLNRKTAGKKGPARVLPRPQDEAEKQRLRVEADKIRERMIMGACGDLQDQLYEYSDSTIINAKTRRIRIKLTII